MRTKEKSLKTRTAQPKWRVRSACERNSSAANCISVRFSFVPFSVGPPKSCAIDRFAALNVVSLTRGHVRSSDLRALLRCFQVYLAFERFWQRFMWIAAAANEPEARTLTEHRSCSVFMGSKHSLSTQARTHACLICNEVLSSDTLISALRVAPCPIALSGVASVVLRRLI